MNWVATCMQLFREKVETQEHKIRNTEDNRNQDDSNLFYIFTWGKAVSVWLAYEVVQNKKKRKADNIWLIQA